MPPAPTSYSSSCIRCSSPLWVDAEQLNGFARVDVEHAISWACPTCVEDRGVWRPTGCLHAAEMWLMDRRFVPIGPVWFEVAADTWVSRHG